MRLKRSLLLTSLPLVISIAVIGCNGACTCLPEAIVGEWSGAAVQYDSLGRSAWTMSVMLNEITPRVVYKSLGCTAVLELLACTENSVRFKEHYPSDPEKRCVDGGVTELILLGDSTARYIWYFADGRKGAVGSLFRSGNK